MSGGGASGGSPAPPVEQGAASADGRTGPSSPATSQAASQAYAAVDLGTNNCRLLIAQPAATGFRVVDAFSRIVRLGEGVEHTGRLSDAAINRTVSALRVCATKIRRANALRVRTVATEACRRAENGQDFLDRVQRQTGIALEIIDPQEEAALALAGCSPLVDPACTNALVFDIGGGSTELIWVETVAGAPPRLKGWVSLALGVVTLTERHGGNEVTPEAYRRMVETVADQLEAFEDRHGIREAASSGGAHFLGTSGTVTTLAAVHLGLPRYDRSQVDGAWIPTGEISQISDMLSGMSFQERANHPCIRRARADLVIAGCAIMEAIIAAWPMARLRVADRGLREGMLTQMMPAAADAAAAAAAGAE